MPRKMTQAFSYHIDGSSCFGSACVGIVFAVNFVSSGGHSFVVDIAVVASGDEYGVGGSDNDYGYCSQCDVDDDDDYERAYY